MSQKRDDEAKTKEKQRILSVQFNRENGSRQVRAIKLLQKLIRRLLGKHVQRPVGWLEHLQQCLTEQMTLLRLLLLGAGNEAAGAHDATVLSHCPTTSSTKHVRWAEIGTKRVEDRASGAGGGAVIERERITE